MKKLLAFCLAPLLCACVRGDIPVPPAGPGRQDAICAIAFGQWLGVNSHDVQVLGRSAKGANAVVNLGTPEPPVAGFCEVTPAGQIVAFATDQARVAPAP